MDYSEYKVLEFRRKFFKLFGAAITIFDGSSTNVVGFIKMKALRLKADISVFTDKTQSQTIIHIGRRKVFNINPQYDIFDSVGNTELGSLRFRSFRSIFVRIKIDLLDPNDNIIGAVNETSSNLAIARRWARVVPYIGEFIELVFAFVPQTFEILYGPEGTQQKVAGQITHRKNPLIVKMSLDTTKAQTLIDQRINIGICTILSLLDAYKNM